MNKEKRYFVYEGDIVRAVTETRKGAERYMQPGRKIKIEFIEFYK